MTRAYDDEGDTQPGDLAIGAMLINEFDLKRRRPKRKPQFPFGFTARAVANGCYTPQRNRHHDTARSI